MGDKDDLRFDGATMRVDGEDWLHGISFRASNGLTLLAGPTRAGKTTIMRIAAGLERPTSGRVWLDGVDVAGVSVRKRDVGFVYQEFVNYPALTVSQNISAPLRQTGSYGKNEISERVDEVASLLKLGPYMQRRPGELSGGQQQRVAIARALSKRSRLLIFDEPLANLDYKLREELRDELFRIFETRDSIVLYSTTEPIEALTFGGQTVIVDEGRILQHSLAIDAFRRPKTTRVARVFSDPPMSIFDAEVVAGDVSIPGVQPFAAPQHFSELEAGPVQLGVRPHRVFTEASGPTDIEFSGPLELAELTGSETYLSIGHRAGPLMAQVDGIHDATLGETMSLFVSAAAMFAFDSRTGALIASPHDRHSTMAGSVADG